MENPKDEFVKYFDDLQEFDVQLQKGMKRLLRGGVPAWCIAIIIGKEYFNIMRTGEEANN